MTPKPSRAINNVKNNNKDKFNNGLTKGFGERNFKNVSSAINNQMISVHVRKAANVSKDSLYS